jgi:arsenite methyltransferase
MQHVAKDLRSEDYIATARLQELTPSFAQPGVDMGELSRRIASIEQIFDLDKLSKRGLEESEISRYYKRSALGYRFVHCADGSMHMALNPDGQFSKDGYFGPVREVERRIAPDSTAILELAVGRGFNISYLARRYPKVHFSGVDITPNHIKAARRRTAQLSNVSFYRQSFQQLPFDTGSFDMVFVVESLCYATDMPRALCEAHRVLRPGGCLIVIDGWRTEQFSNLPPVAQKAAALTEQAMSVGNPSVFSDWLSQARAVEFALAQDVDLTASIMPNLLRFEAMAGRFLRHASLARLSTRLLPLELLANAIAAYLMPLTVNCGAHTYRLVSMRRTHSRRWAGRSSPTRPRSVVVQQVGQLASGRLKPWAIGRPARRLSAPASTTRVSAGSMISSTFMRPAAP